VGLNPDAVKPKTKIYICCFSTKYAALRKLYLQMIYIIYTTARMDYAKSSGLGDDHGTEVE
jgi:hypothetical protein